MRHGGWAHFEQMVRHFQGLGLTELFSQNYMKADPVEKDKRHYAIVRTNNVLEKLLALPRWLAKTDPKRWEEVTAFITKEENANE